MKKLWSLVTAGPKALLGRVVQAVLTLLLVWCLGLLLGVLAAAFMSGFRVGWDGLLGLAARAGL